MSKGEKFLSDTNIQREQEKHLDSLISSDKAVVALQEEGSWGKIAETYSARSITFIHLADQTQDEHYVILAKSSASVAVEIARTSDTSVDLVDPLLGLGRIHGKLKEYSTAATYYQEALDVASQNSIRPSIIADIKIHLAVCKFKEGDKQSIDRLKEALKDLENADEDLYVKNVWVSGAYMKLAEVLVEDSPEESKKHLVKAKEIIDSDDRLTIRLKQWETLSKKLQAL
jgi:tetratricopeptide (TPR) repeat protein